MSNYAHTYFLLSTPDNNPMNNGDSDGTVRVNVSRETNLNPATTATD